MKELDFLPRSFREARRRRHVIRRNTLYSIGLAIALGCLHVINQSEIRSAQASLAATHANNEERNVDQHRLQTLRAREQVLEDRLEWVSRLEDDAPLDAVIAEITRHMDNAMAIRSLVVETTPVGNADPDWTDPLLDRGPTRVVLDGVAPNDVQVGIFFGRLAECALFDDVKMSFSQEAEEVSRQMREFQLIFTVRRVATNGSRD